MPLPAPAVYPGPQPQPAPDPKGRKKKDRADNIHPAVLWERLNASKSGRGATQYNKIADAEAEISRDEVRDAANYGELAFDAATALSGVGAGRTILKTAVKGSAKRYAQKKAAEEMAKRARDKAGSSLRRSASNFLRQSGQEVTERTIAGKAFPQVGKALPVTSRPVAKTLATRTAEAEAKAAANAARAKAQKAAMDEASKSRRKKLADTYRGMSGG